jgi:hypothetical protein
VTVLPLAAVLAFKWSGAGSASGAALLTAIASFVLALAAYRNSRKNGKGGNGGDDPPLPPPLP